MGAQWDAGDYDERFATLARSGADVHGEANFVAALAPGTVLDAGCGTGRVAIELARRGIEVVGVDRDDVMLGAARAKAPQLRWVQADLHRLELGRVFDVVVMAGNVLLFVDPGSETAVVEACARHVAPEGRLVAGFQLTGAYGLDAYDEACAAAGVTPEARYATWSAEAWPGDGSYHVSVHRRP